MFGIVLTHGDTDHIEPAERLRRSGVAVHVHELDAGRARGEVKTELRLGTGQGATAVGLLWYSARRGGLRIRPVAEVVTFIDGASLDLPGSPRIIHLPGHTPGSVAVHAPAVNAVFVGDAMTTRNVLTRRVVHDLRLHAPAAGGDRVDRSAGGRAGDLGTAWARAAVARRSRRRDPGVPTDGTRSVTNTQPSLVLSLQSTREGSSPTRYGPPDVVRIPTWKSRRSKTTRCWSRFTRRR